MKLKITKLHDSFEGDSPNKIATPKSKKSIKVIENVSATDSLTKIEVNQDLNCNSKSNLERDDRSTEILSTLSSNHSIKSENQLNLTKSKSFNVENSKNFDNRKKTGKKDILIGIKLSIEIEDFLNNTNILNPIQFPARKIGTLTIEERKIKIEKYLQKRKKRTWNKKISYDCRKKVADSRLRIKGRFVTKEQAVAMLGDDGIYDLDKISSSDIKNLLILKFGSSITKKKDINNLNNYETKSINNNISERKKSDFKEETIVENEKMIDILIESEKLEL